MHDLDLNYHAPQMRWDAFVAQLITGGWRALQRLRARGDIRAIGIGINPLGMIPRFLELFDDIDFFLLAGRYTLMEQGALQELNACYQRGVGVIIGAAFNSGILATGAVPGARYDYREATSGELDKVARIEHVCRRHGTPLVAAALQFPLAHPAVASVIPGPIRAEEADVNVGAFHHPIPADLWRELKAEGLLEDNAPTPDGSAGAQAPEVA